MRDYFGGLVGRRALITGSRGIGQAIAIALAEHGCSIAIVGRNARSIEQTTAQVREIGVKAVDLPGDLGQPGAPACVARQALAQMGQIDILVNVASVSPPLRPLLECDEEEWDRTMALNLKAYFLLARELVPGMINRGWGRVINLTSSTALKARAGMGEYAVSKAAEIMLTRQLAREVGKDGVTVNALAPVLTRTDSSFEQWTNPDEVAHVTGLQAIPRLAEAEDMVGAVLLLASDAGRMITGHTLVVDGGLLA
jgi:NAD(P)-dependent dehydrogenase (short-subunit alcohol dehydrogenase family)